jgi:hypothetical protein
VKKQKLVEKKKKKGLFKSVTAETPDPTFSISHFDQNYSRDAPDFVNIKVNF